MTITASALVPGFQLGTTTAVILPPAGNATQVTSAVFANNGAATANVTINVVRSGGAPGPINTLIPSASMTGNTTYIAKELIGRNLAVGDYVTGSATVAGQVSVFLDGITITS